MDKYNGWTNYFTWLVSLWLTEGRFESPEDFGLVGRVDEFTLAGAIANTVEEMRDCLDIPQNDMFADLLQAALDSVNWYEIAVNMLAE